MNNQEAIEVMFNEWKCIDRNDGINCDRKCESCDLVMDVQTIREAFNMAISALQEQEAKTQLSAEGTTSDLIRRQAAIDALDCLNGVEEVLRALPSAHPKIEERTEEFAQNVPKEDLISRKAAIDAECEVCQIAPKKERGHNCTYYVHGCKEIECLKALPPAQPEVLACGEGVLNAQPERKKGEWTKDCACEICGFKPWYERDIHTLSFCPNCGADMREDQDG